MLGHSEELILSVLRNMDREASTSDIYEAIASKLPDVSRGAVYVAIDRLTKRALVIRRKGQTRRERGGKAQYYYKMTDAARSVLAKMQENRTAIGTLRPNRPMRIATLRASSRRPRPV
jgi:DNA-binding PadR family transcriptional regulator